MISNDHRHIGIKSHFQITVMLTRYAQKMFQSLLELIKRKLSSKIEAIDNIAPLYMKIGVTKPYCWSLITTNWRKPNLSQSLNITVLRHTGFREIQMLRPRLCTQVTGMIRLVAGNQRKEEHYLILFLSPQFDREDGKQEFGWLSASLYSTRECKSLAKLRESERNPVTITGRDYGRTGSQTRIYFLGVDITVQEYKAHITN